VAPFVSSASGAPALRRRRGPRRRRAFRQTRPQIPQRLVRFPQVVVVEEILAGAAKKRRGKKPLEEHLEHRLDCCLVRRGIQNMNFFSIKEKKININPSLSDKKKNPAGATNTPLTLPLIYSFF